MTATRDALARGSLQIMGGTTVLVSFPINSVGGTISGDIWTLGFDAYSVAALADGTASWAQIIDKNGTAQETGLTAGTSGTDVVLDNLSITLAQNVTINSATITHAS